MSQQKVLMFPGPLWPRDGQEMSSDGYDSVQVMAGWVAVSEAS